MHTKQTPAYVPVDVETLGRLAAECDLKAEQFRNHPAERIKFESMAAGYREAQELEMANRQNYPHANILLPDRPARRLNYTTIFCLAMLALFLIGWAWDFGWLDGLLPR